MNGTVIWTSLEVSFGVICACLPTMRPVVRWAMRKLDISTQDTGKSSQRYFNSNLASSRGFETLSGHGADVQGHSLQTTAARSNENNGDDVMLGQIRIKNELQLEAESI